MQLFSSKWTNQYSFSRSCLYNYHHYHDRLCTAPKFKDAFDEAECSAINTLNGFVFVLSKDGDLVYLSDNVERHLGLNHIDLLGQSIYDFSHPCDHDDIKLFLEPLTSACNAAKFMPKAEERPVVPSTAIMGQSTGPFFIRMKCTLTNKGRNCNLKSAYFKVGVLCFIFSVFAGLQHWQNLRTDSFLFSLNRLSNAPVEWSIWRRSIRQRRNCWETTFASTWLRLGSSFSIRVESKFLCRRMFSWVSIRLTWSLPTPTKGKRRTCTTLSHALFFVSWHIIIIHLLKLHLHFYSLAPSFSSLALNNCLDSTQTIWLAHLSTNTLTPATFSWWMTFSRLVSPILSFYYHFLCF